MMPEDYIQNQIEIETPHLRKTGMTRYEKCWEALMTQMLNESMTIDGGVWPIIVLKRMRLIENQVCGEMEGDE